MASVEGKPPMSPEAVVWEVTQVETPLEAVGSPSGGVEKPVQRFPPSSSPPETPATRYPHVIGLRGDT